MEQGKKFEKGKDSCFYQRFCLHVFGNANDISQFKEFPFLYVEDSYIHDSQELANEKAICYHPSNFKSKMVMPIA